MPDTPDGPQPSDSPGPPDIARRRRWRTLLVPVLLLGGLLWISNWFYQRSRLFAAAKIDLMLGKPRLPWYRLIGDEAARELLGLPVEINPHDKVLSWYPVGLIAG